MSNVCGCFCYSPVKDEIGTVDVQVQCRCTPTETIFTTIKDGGAEDGHLDFHTVQLLSSEC